MEVSTKTNVKISKFFRDRSGAAAVEFAWVAPFLFMIVVAIVDFGWLQYQKMILQQINREGVSAAIAGLDPETAMLSVITIKRLSGTPTVDISCLNESGSIVSPCAIDGAMKAEVATITFAVTLDHTPFFTYSEAFGIGGNISDTLKIQIQ